MTYYAMPPRDEWPTRIDLADEPPLTPLTPEARAELVAELAALQEACDVTDCGNIRCDVCDERMTCLGPEPAPSCGAHVECVDCHTDNPCRDCRRAGGAA